MVDFDNPGDPTRSILVVLMLSVSAIVAAQFVVLPAMLIDPGVADPAVDPSRAGFLALMTLNFTAFYLVGAIYLWWTERGWSYLDLRVPSLREWGITIAAVFASIGVVIGVSLLSMLLGIEGSDNEIVQLIGDDSMLVLYMIVIVFLFNAPAEEFLFRNVVQKRLYAPFSKMGAVIATSVIFALVHFPVYAFAADGGFETPSAIAISLTVVFAGSIIFGYVYARTENLVVPILAHAGYNSFIFFMLYLAIEFGDPEDLEVAMAFLPV